MVHSVPVMQVVCAMRYFLLFQSVLVLTKLLFLPDVPWLAVFLPTLVPVMLTIPIYVAAILLAILDFVVGKED